MELDYKCTLPFDSWLGQWDLNEASYAQQGCIAKKYIFLANIKSIAKK